MFLQAYDPLIIAINNRERELRYKYHWWRSFDFWQYLASIIRNREVLISADPVTRPRALSHVKANKYWYVLPYFRPRLLSLIIFGSEMPRGKICQYMTPTRVEPEPDLFSRYRLRVHLNLSISAIGRSLINRLRLARILIWKRNVSSAMNKRGLGCQLCEIFTLKCSGPDRSLNVRPEPRNASE